MNDQENTVQISNWLFGKRTVLIWSFTIMTLVLAEFSSRTFVDSSFTKQLPSNHEYIQTFTKHEDKFGGANRVIIALTVDKGTIFTKEYFDLLKLATDEVYYIPGVDRAQVTSIWTPNTRFIEIVEDGFVGGNVVPADFSGSEEDLLEVRDNIIKSGKLGLLVASDYSGTLISAELQEINPQTGERLNYLEVADHLEKDLRLKFESLGKNIGLKVHIIGFAKVIGDIADGTANVLIFFAISFLVTGILVFFYSQSFKLTVLPMATSLVAVIWQLGLLHLLGYGIDPMSILVPFLVFAIGVSHGVQMVRSFRTCAFSGMSGLDAAKECFQQLLIPGGAALLTDTIGFVSILLIDIPIVQDLAISASLGVAAIIFTNLFLLPLLLSYQDLNLNYKEKVVARREKTQPAWDYYAMISRSKPSVLIVLIAIMLAVMGTKYAGLVKIGDQHRGVPELRHDSRYNQDTQIITDKFTIGVDLVTVIAETVQDGVIDYEVMELVDRFAWHMLNVDNVQSVTNLATLAKVANAGFNEGYPKWQILPQNPVLIAQAISPFEPTTGLMNEDGSVIPVMIYLKDHKAETIERLILAVKKFARNNPSDKVKFKLASGNIGVMAAQNEVVAAAQFPILMYVFAAVTLLCVISFRTWRAPVCIVPPLALVSVLAYAFMYFLGIGLKSNTLPVVALGIGVGVDYGIYFFARLQRILERGEFFEDAFRSALHRTGSAVLFTGFTLALGVSTWIFSTLKFQADMGILLTFMFLLNMLGAILLMPAIARWLYPHHFQGRF